MSYGFVYFFQSVGLTPIKIGMTNNLDLELRISSLKTSCPYGGKLIGFIKCENPDKLEKSLHEKYKNLRTYGEWFNISEEEVKMLINEHSPKLQEMFIKFEAYMSIGGQLPKIAEKNFANKIDLELIDFINSDLSILNFPISEVREIIKSNVKKYEKSTDKNIGMAMSLIGYKSVVKKVNGRTARFYTECSVT
jgi:hypothetical protein